MHISLVAVVCIYSDLLKIMYSFLAALGPCRVAWAFSSCGEQGLLSLVMRRLLTAAASLVAEVRTCFSSWSVGSVVAPCRL